VDPRAGLDGRKILSPPGFDPGLSSPWSVAIPTELPDPGIYMCVCVCVCVCVWSTWRVLIDLFRKVYKLHSHYLVGQR